MPLQERIAYGYKKVIMLMLISGLLSIIAIGVLLAGLLNYVQKINASDIAVKMCRVNVNAAARNIREMALDDDEASYDDYEKTITKLLADVDAQLKIIKETGVVSEENYTEYATALSDWEDISTSIIEEIRQGQNQKGVEDILTQCTPALNKLVDIALKLDCSGRTSFHQSMMRSSFEKKRWPPISIRLPSCLTVREMPPNSRVASSTVTSYCSEPPSLTSSQAAVRPAGPPPMMTTDCFCVTLKSPYKQNRRYSTRR